MYGKQNKWCFVPRCTSTSVSTPNKFFVRVPGDDFDRKKSWFNAARRDLPKSKSEFFYCEDHFNLDKIMENYTRFKLMGGKIIMKQNVVQHIFNCQPDQKRTASSILPRWLPMKRERTRLVAEAIAADEQYSAYELLETPSTSTAPLQDVESSHQQQERILPKQKSVGIHTGSFTFLFDVQCNLTVTLSGFSFLCSVYECESRSHKKGHYFQQPAAVKPHNE
ncbi:hypothetical protein NQ315_014814 [Exocentrus adspersus]|uniref:THAP-type domain-containing protein n=1 Tax=Exocentrus adspersus TaxID=1586481 RepID=A0AAV8VN15_9CUCU|nr:hypothetical protein NQ315_014814 [Exocentrus adspersus]